MKSGACWGPGTVRSFCSSGCLSRFSRGQCTHTGGRDDTSSSISHTPAPLALVRAPTRSSSFCHLLNLTCLRGRIWANRLLTVFCCNQSLCFVLLVFLQGSVGSALPPPASFSCPVFEWRVQTHCNVCAWCSWLHVELYFLSLSVSELCLCVDLNIAFSIVDCEWALDVNLKKFFKYLFLIYE